MARALKALTPLFVSACLGCAAQGGAPSSSPATAPTQASVQAHVAHVPSEALPLDAVYADLVRSATELENTPRAPSTCLLQESASAYQLRAELASAVRPLPQPPEDLDETLKSAPHVELLSAWGRHGDGNGKLALAAFTRSAPTSNAFALLLSDRGIALRSPSGSTVAPIDGLDLTQLSSTLTSLDPDQHASLFVAAEAGLSLHALHRVLTALAPRQVVLAVSLAPSTSLPLPVSATAKVARCAEGLSATAEPDGSLPRSELLRGVSSIKEHAADCLTRGDARGAAGGRLTLAMRIDASGRVQEACIETDLIDDPGLSACVIGLAKQTTFAPPSPSGVIDLELPLLLLASPTAVQRPTCEVRPGP